MTDPKEGEAPETITYHYIKSQFFRTIHVDGAWGGVSPRGLVSMTLFSERRPIPRQVVYRLGDDRLGEEIEDLRVMKEGAVREAECHLFFDVNVAKSIRKWLDDKIEAVEAVREARDQDGG